MLSNEFLPGFVIVDIVVRWQRHRENLPGGAQELPKNSSGVPKVGDEESPLVHDANKAAWPHCGKAWLGLPLAWHERDESLLCGQKCLPDCISCHTLQAGRGLYIDQT